MVVTLYILLLYFVYTIILYTVYTNHFLNKQNQSTRSKSTLDSLFCNKFLTDYHTAICLRQYRQDVTVCTGKLLSDSHSNIHSRSFLRRPQTNAQGRRCVRQFGPRIIILFYNEKKTQTSCFVCTSKLLSDNNSNIYCRRFLASVYPAFRQHVRPLNRAGSTLRRPQPISQGRRTIGLPKSS